MVDLVICQQISELRYIKLSFTSDIISSIKYYPLSAPWIVEWLLNHLRTQTPNSSYQCRKSGSNDFSSVTLYHLQAVFRNAPVLSLSQLE